MKHLFYVTLHQFRNRLKKALKKPVTYLFIALAVFYVVMMLGAFIPLIQKAHFDSAEGLVMLITVLFFLLLPSSYVMYAQRKGIVFKPSHAHFIFNAPISPKRVLLYGALKNIFMDVVFGVAICLVGFFVFQVSLPVMLLVFLLWLTTTAVQELSIVVLLYGNDRVNADRMSFAGKVLLGVLVLAGLFLFWYVRRYGFSLASLREIFGHPALQMIPLIGWNIAVFRLVLLGADTVNLIGSGLYVLSTVLLVFAAWKMPCEGGYYEEAAKFADEYQALRQRKAKGESTTGKEKYRRLKGGIEGHGASAIFFRQLQEYRKARFFIFNSMTVVCLIIAVIMAKAYDGSGKYAGVALLGILGYIVFCMAGYKGKWEKELENPYLFLIPAKPLAKMWYATLMEHIKSLLDGTVMCLLIGISWHLPVWQIVSAILIYVLFQAIKMYMRIFTLYILGDHFGTQIRTLLQMLLDASLIGIGIAVAAVVGIAININLVFPILLIYSMIVTVAVMLLASTRFEVLEQLD